MAEAKLLPSRLAVLVARCKKLRVLLGRPQYRRALRHGVAAAVEHDQTPLLHEYRTVLDVGANRGQFALVAARRFPNASLVCFEPQPKPRAALERALARHPRLRVVDKAVAAFAGEAVLHVTRADDSSSLRPTTDLQVRTFPGTEVIDEIAIVTARLDSLVQTDDLTGPVLLKVDVQGTELEVLRGAAHIVERIDTILIECSFVELYSGQALADEVIALLHTYGYYLATVMAPTVDHLGRVLQADLVFERPR